MAALYPYSLVPVLAVAVLLFFTALRHRARGLAAYCLSIALWSGMLAALWIPALADVAERLAAVGAFIAASYLHAAYDVTGQRRYGLVYFAYAVAVALTAAGALSPGLLYGPRAMVAGPLFWPSMALAVAAAVMPAYRIVASYRHADAAQKAPLRWLLVAGLLSDVGGLSNAVLLSHARPTPYPMFLVLAGLLLLTNVVRSYEPRAEQRVLERSLAYAAITAFVSGGFLFGVVTLYDATRDGPASAGYRGAALFLVLMAALAFEPVRQQLQERLGRTVAPGRVSAADLSEALDLQSARAAHHERLAEIGALTSAVAHEVRNPLGVLKAHLKLLERGGAEPETVTAMREQIGRAEAFVEDLLRYGRPRPLDARDVDLLATAELAASTARQGVGLDVGHVSIDVEGEEDLVGEADPAQLGQALVVLVDNALLALADRDAGRIVLRVGRTEDGGARLEVEDDGPGIPEALAPRLFEPFVTSRKREGPRPGTGLGLAIARGIAERHGGRLELGPPGALGGARFVLTLPKAPSALALAPPPAKEGAS